MGDTSNAFHACECKYKAHAGGKDVCTCLALASAGYKTQQVTPNL